MPSNRGQGRALFEAPGQEAGLPGLTAPLSAGGGSGTFQGFQKAPRLPGSSLKMEGLDQAHGHRTRGIGRIEEDLAQEDLRQGGLAPLQVDLREPAERLLSHGGRSEGIAQTLQSRQISTPFRGPERLSGPLPGEGFVHLPSIRGQGAEQVPGIRAHAHETGAPLGPLERLHAHLEKGAGKLGRQAVQERHGLVERPFLHRLPRLVRQPGRFPRLGQPERADLLPVRVAHERFTQDPLPPPEPVLLGRGPAGKEEEEEARQRNHPQGGGSCR